VHRCADADRAHCAHAKVLNAPHRSCGYKTGYRRYRRRPRYSRPHPHHLQTVTPSTPQDPTLARLPLLACLKLPTSKQRVSPSPEATTRRVPQPVGYPLTRVGKTHGMPGSQPTRERVRVPHRIPAGLPVPMPTATHRWTDGVRGRGFGSVWGNGWRGRPHLSGGPSGIRRPHTEVVAVDAATTVTHRWTDGARGQGLRSVWGNGQRGRPHRFQVRVLRLGRRGGCPRGCPTGALHARMTSSKHVNHLVHTTRVPHVCTLGKGAGIVRVEGVHSE
jgi:hypothetical protein